MLVLSYMSWRISLASESRINFAKLSGDYRGEMIIMTSTPIDLPPFLVAQGPAEKGEVPFTFGPHAVSIRVGS